MISQLKKGVVWVLLIGLTSFVILTRLVWPATSIDLGNDQVRDIRAGIQFNDNQDIERGVENTGGFYLMPHYYYLMKFTTGLSPSPLPSVYLHSLCNVLALLGVYWIGMRFFASKSRLWPLLAVLLLAFNYRYIWMSNAIWNPNLLPLALVAYLILLYYLSSPLQLWKNLAISILAGMTMSFAMGLHGMAIFCFPLIAAIWIVWRGYRKWLSMLGGVIGFVVGATPYWLLELGSGFANTRAFWDYVRASNDYYVGFGLWDVFLFRIQNFLGGIINVASIYYMPGTYASLVLVLCAVAVFGLLYKIKESPMQQLLAITLGVYLLVHSSLTGIDWPHYMVIGSIPIALGSINTLLASFRHQAYLYTCVTLGILSVGLILNGISINRYNIRKFHPSHRQLNQDDYSAISSAMRINGDTSLCIDRELFLQRDVFDYFFLLDGYAASAVTGCSQEDYTGAWLIYKDFGRPIIPLKEVDSDILIQQPHYELYSTR